MWFELRAAWDSLMASSGVIGRPDLPVDSDSSGREGALGPSPLRPRPFHDVCVIRRATPTRGIEHGIDLEADRSTWLSS